MRRGISKLSPSMFALLSLGSVALLASSSNASEKPAVDNAFSVWAGDGHLVQTGPKSIVIIGTFGGLLFTNVNNAPTDIGMIACPMSLEADLSNDSLNGTGSCAFTANDGAQAFGTWTCTGKFLEGCRGDFHINRGNGRLKDLKAESSFVLRGRMAEFVDYPNEQVSAIGIAVWPDLHVLTQVSAAK
jgi:hypothetical protein